MGLIKVPIWAMAIEQEQPLCFLKAEEILAQVGSPHLGGLVRVSTTSSILSRPQYEHRATTVSQRCKGKKQRSDFDVQPVRTEGVCEVKD